MTVAFTLKDAAHEAFDNLYTLWLADTLKSQTATFCDAVLAQVSEQDVNARQVADWATLLDITQDQMPGASVSFTTGLVVAADQVYRLCWLAYALNQQGLLTNAQATAILAAYNAAYS